MKELKKYILRFGIVFLISLPFIIMTGIETLRVFLYKITMCGIGITLAELIWAVYFKPVYGKTEEMSADDKKYILMFRGILYAAIILALTLGL